VAASFFFLRPDFLRGGSSGIVLVRRQLVLSCRRAPQVVSGQLPTAATTSATYGQSCGIFGELSIAHWFTLFAPRLAAGV